MTGPQRDQRGSLQTLAEHIEGELERLQPAELQQARQKLQEAQQAHVTLVRGLDSLNFRHSLRTGGAGPLQVSAQLFQAAPDYQGVKIKPSKQSWP